ncbi:Lysosomal acid phosphatase like protein [Argiope bruennichi]|uniref:acid phosphatase n=1 Tax=Argiope bruennichi TaxID=94029 RepID=A0A8T0ELK7_ARGBR|nr:Lysosomal acid phosphatase like protein [Argiope bruennichi]
MLVSQRNVYSCTPDELILVQMISRHGDVSPSQLYPEDPNPADVWKGGLEDLTLKGKFQCYALGCYLRARYGDFITSDPHEVEVLSASKRYCVNSAQSLVTALYAPSSDWEIVEQFPWQPIFIQYGNQTIEKSLNNLPCPSADEETRRILSEEIKMLQNYEGLIYFWQENSGWNFESLKDIEALYDVIQTEAKYNLNIPTWAQNYWSYLQYLHDLSFILKLKTNQQKRLRGGPLVDLVFDKMKKKASEELGKTKVFVYSTHGLNIAAYLSALGMWNGMEPESCATVLIELYRHQDDHYIRHMYLNSTTPEREPQQYHVLTVPGCGEFCPLDYILEISKDMIPQNWDKECQHA